MQSVKLLGSTLAKTAPVVCASLLLLSAMASFATAGGGFATAPEVDPSCFSSGIALLASGALLLTSRRSRQ